MIRFLLLLMVIFGLNSACCGQKLLFYKNRHRQALYKEGNVISFRVNNDKSKVTAQIIGFEDSLIVFQGFKLNPKVISHLYVDGKTITWYILRYKYERIFLFSGSGYLILDVLNTGELNEKTLIISGSLIAAGLLARWLISDAIKIKGQRKLQIID
jgi:hypothetical protein